MKPDHIFHIGNDNWIFLYYEKRKDKWRLYSFFNIHSKKIVTKYDDTFKILEDLRFDTKDELDDVCQQTLCQIEIDVMGEYNEK